MPPVLRILKREAVSADKKTVSSISGSISSSSLQSIINALQSAGVAAGTTAGTSSAGQPPDSSQLSPLAQLLSTLQQLQQSDPTKYKQVTQQIATNLQNAAQTATSDGNTTAANQLNQLATDFSNASQSGQLPNIQDLSQAVGGGGHHHHHGEAAPSETSGTSSGTSGTSNTNQTLNQLLSALASTGTQSANQNDSLNPMAIIINTLATAGVTNNSNS
jgi:hypothetical protein